MITEYIIAATLMWTAPNGQVMGVPMNGHYPTHQACTQALMNRINWLTKVNGTPPTPVGTELCMVRQRPAPTAAEQKWLDDLRRDVERELAEDERKQRK